MTPPASSFSPKPKAIPFFWKSWLAPWRSMTRPRPMQAIPNTVHAVLAERIDRLAPAAKQLLQTAAVVGAEAPATLLHAVGRFA